MKVLLEVGKKKDHGWTLLYQKVENGTILYGNKPHAFYRFHWRSPEGKLITRGQAWIHCHSDALELIAKMIHKEKEM